jgi:NAD(P)-dependent dehydrogenase (short-subunit alcohol dehydrogenase family)
MGRLDGKVCVITGAASGIGAESVQRFRQEGAVVVGVDVAPGVEEQVDVTDDAGVRDLYARVRAEHGRVDVLFNNAGISPPDDVSVLDTDLDAWRRVA